jgi:hypothetical protein
MDMHRPLRDLEVIRMLTFILSSAFVSVLGLAPPLFLVHC